MKLITVEQMEAATERLLETGRQVGADSWQQRVKNQTPHCKFGEEGICCRICSMPNTTRAISSSARETPTIACICWRKAASN